MARTTPPPTHDPKYLWDSIGPAYEIAFPSVPAQVDSLTWILSELSSNGGSQAKCLDIGCGAGRPVCARLAESGHDVLGIDVSPKMLDAAKKNVPRGNARFEMADVRSWNPPSDSGGFDVVTAYFSLIANLTQNELKDTMRRVYSWLVPGGIFVFGTVPVAADMLEISWMGRPVLVSGFDAQEWGRIIREVGFEVVKEEESKFLPNGLDAGLVEKEEDAWEEPHLFVCARKP